MSVLCVITLSARSNSLSSRCLRYQLIIDCERLTHDIVHKVATILAPEKQISKKHAFHFPICSDCFNEVTIELSQLEKANQHKRMRKLDSTYIETLFRQKSPTNHHMKPARYSPTFKSIARRALKHFGSFNLSRSENNFEHFPMDAHNKFFEAAVHHNLHHIPAIEEMSLDLVNMKLSDGLLAGILDSVVFSLTSSS